MSKQRKLDTIISTSFNSAISASDDNMLDNTRNLTKTSKLITAERQFVDSDKPTSLSGLHIFSLPRSENLIVNPWFAMKLPSGPTYVDQVGYAAIDTYEYWMSGEQQYIMTGEDMRLLAQAVNNDYRKDELDIIGDGASGEVSIMLPMLSQNVLTHSLENKNTPLKIGLLSSDIKIKIILLWCTTKQRKSVYGFFIIRNT